jgi:hypothetical protein
MRWRFLGLLARTELRLIWVFKFSAFTFLGALRLLETGFLELVCGLGQNFLVKKPAFSTPMRNINSGPEAGMISNPCFKSWA